MRAISSRRPLASSSTTRVAVVPLAPRAALAFSTRQCLTARAATCGEWVTTRTCSRAAEPRQPLADRRRGGAADAAIDLVEHQRRHRIGLGQHDLQRQQEARQLAARGDLRQRPRRQAGIGRDLEGDAVEPMLAPVALRQPLEAGGEAGLVELQRRQLGGDGGVELLRRLVARGCSAPRPPRCRPGARRLPPCASAASRPRLVVERGELLGQLRAMLGQQIGRHAVLAREVAQREQPLLDLLQPLRRQVGIAQQAAPAPPSASVSSLPARSSAAITGATRSPALSAMRSSRRCAAAQAWSAPSLAGEILERRRQRLQQLLAVHQQAALLAQLRFLAGLGIDRRQLADGVAQDTPRRAAPAGAAPPLGARRAAARQPRQSRASSAALAFEAAEGVEQRAMIAGVEQALLLELAFDLDQRTRRSGAAARRSTGWSLTKARLRPSAASCRRRISGAASSRPCSRSSANTG